MRGHELLEAIENLDPAYIDAAAKKPKSKHMGWIKWVAIAASLCLVLACTLSVIFREMPDQPLDTMNPADGPPSLIVNGRDFYISSRLAVSNELPEGFAYAGNASVGGFVDCPYYTNPDMPEWVYVYHEVMTDGTVDSTGTLNRTEQHNAYVRYVDVRLRGKDLICYNGQYYISMWSVSTYGSEPDVSADYFEAMQTAYGIRIAGDAPAGFVSAGIAEFSGFDTVPRGELTSNAGAYEVYVNPDEPDVVLMATQWYTAAVGENGETKHNGFNVYIRYVCPLT